MGQKGQAERGARTEVWRVGTMEAPCQRQLSQFQVTNSAICKVMPRGSQAQTSSVYNTWSRAQEEQVKKQEPCQQYQPPAGEQGLGLCEWSSEARELRQVVDTQRKDCCLFLAACSLHYTRVNASGSAFPTAETRMPVHCPSG